MAKHRFNPDLASEMTWSECVLAASLDNRDYANISWVCAVCGDTLMLAGDELPEAVADRFLDHGWRYRRDKTGMNAVCDKCRSHK